MLAWRKRHEPGSSLDKQVGTPRSKGENRPAYHGGAEGAARSDSHCVGSFPHRRRRLSSVTLLSFILFILYNQAP